MLKVFGLAHCSTCQKATTWLDDNKIEHSFHCWKKQGVPAEILNELVNKLGTDGLVNRTGFTWRGLDDDDRQKLLDGTDAAFEILVEKPALIKRPLFVTEDGMVFKGFSQKVRDALQP